MTDRKEDQGGWFWTNVPSGPGVLNIRRKADGKSYFVAAADMRQRAYDAHRLLTAGTHHCPDLQAAWLAAADDFEITAVATVRREAYLRAFKQTFIEQAGQNCWNRKNSVARS